jgi:dihydroxyacetone kinase phosphoprotein-dependent L subunit
VTVDHARAAPSGGLRAAILAAAEAIEAAREPLCALDATTGDGDHGMTMTIGARGVRRQLERVADEDPVRLVRAAAAGMGSAGGAIGPIYGRGLSALADSVASERDAEDVAVARRAVDAAAAAVAALGGARPGDKTILDALVPFVEALASAESRGRSLAEAATEAAAAARAGADATASLRARVGRSSRFGERSIGTPDPGATSFAIIVEALARAVAPST